MTNLDQLNKLTLATLPAITVLAGEDVGLYDQMKQTLFQQLEFDPADLAYSYFDMSGADYSQVALDLESLPFFADQKIVIMDNFQDMTTDKKSYLDEKSLKAFESYLENPVETSRLVILGRGKLDGKRRLVKLLKREALVLEASPMKDEEIRTYFLKQAQDLKLTFEPGVFDQLLVRAQFDFSEMVKHLAFLSEYQSAGSAISQKDIDEAIPKSLQDNIFDLTQLVLSGKIAGARDLVRDLRLQGEEEIKLIAVMLGQLRFFLQVKLLASQGKSEQQIVTSLSDYLGSKINAYRVKFALRDSRPYSLSHLKLGIKSLIEADYQIKTGVYDKDYLFDLALLKIAGYKS